MRYFCMVGMHDVGFDRLIRALDEFAGRHPGNEVTMQIGSTRYRPRYAAWFDFKTELEPEIERADIVVTHGSMCLFDALRLGKRLVVAPRLAAHGEVINDHQVKFSGNIARRYGFPVLLDLTDLDRVLLQVEAAPPPSPIRFGETGLYRALGSYLDGIASGSR